MKKCPVCFYENPDQAEACSHCQYSFDSSAVRQETTLGLEDSGVLQPGGRIAYRYEIIRELGRGGMGVVFLVRDTLLQNQERALKMIQPHLLAQGEALRRFKEEVIISQRLTHPNIVRVFDLNIWRDIRFFTMEYIPGRTLRSWLEERKGTLPAFSPPEILAVLDPLLSALSQAHQRTIHGNIKPENIMLVGNFPEISVKVLDFGIAKAMGSDRFSKTSTVLGTALYMAPEQMGGKTIDHRADLYSAGMILYEMMTGETAMGIFSLPSALGLNLPAAVDEFLTRCLSPNPEGRYPNAEAMLAALKKALAPPDLEKPFQEDRQKPAAEDAERKKRENDEKRKTEIQRREQEARLKKEWKAPTGKPWDSAVSDAPKRGGSWKRLGVIFLVFCTLGLSVWLALPQIMSERPNPDPPDPRVSMEPRDSEHPPKKGTPSQKRITNSLGQEFVLIPAGEFMMGSPESEPERNDDETRHRVKITKPFYMMTTEVTQGQWKAIMGDNPSRLSADGDQYPVENVTWHQAQEFIKKLNAKEGTDKYRLPTEAEWEYAARAGTTSPFAFGACLNSEDANFNGNYPLSGCPKTRYRGKTMPAASLKANAWGLYDMHGNVWEWVQDKYAEDAYTKLGLEDPVHEGAGSTRVGRGGAWNFFAGSCRSADRNWFEPGKRYHTLDYRVDPLGFRLARTM